MLIIRQKVLDYLANALFLTCFCLMRSGCKVTNFLFGFIKIFDHMNQLTGNTKCLSNICLDEVDHLRSIVVFDDVQVVEAETQTLHTV